MVLFDERVRGCPLKPKSFFLFIRTLTQKKSMKNKSFFFECLFSLNIKTRTEMWKSLR